MTKIITFLLFFCILFVSCGSSSHTPDPALLAVDTILETHSDSALVVLEKMNADSFDNYNKSYYYILLTAARNKAALSLIDSDILIDFAINTLSSKRDPDLLACAYLYKGRICGESVRIGSSEYGEIYLEIERSFPELITRIREEYPSIEKENIFILSLYKYGFTSRTIALFLNITDSTVRKRIERLKAKFSGSNKEIGNATA